VSSPERRYIEDPYYATFPAPRSGAVTPVIIDDESRVRMEHMERQLANLTGLVQKALVPPSHPGSGTINAVIAPPHNVTKTLHSSSTLPRNIAIGASLHNPISAPAYRDYIPTRDYRGEIKALKTPL